MLHTAGTVEAYITWASTWHTVCMFLTAVFNDNVEAWHQQCGRGTKLTLKKKKKLILITNEMPKKSKMLKNMWILLFLKMQTIKLNVNMRTRTLTYIKTNAIGF